VEAYFLHKNGDILIMIYLRIDIHIHIYIYMYVYHALTRITTFFFTTKHRSFEEQNLNKLTKKQKCPAKAVSTTRRTTPAWKR